MVCFFFFLFSSLHWCLWHAIVPTILLFVVNVCCFLLVADVLVLVSLSRHSTRTKYKCSVLSPVLFQSRKTEYIYGESNLLLRVLWPRHCIACANIRIITLYTICIGTKMRETCKGEKTTTEESKYAVQISSTSKTYDE